MNSEAVKELLFKIADDALVMSHRNSEWTGIGPVLEEDIAFSSMAQDKLGHSLQLYTMLSDKFGEEHPDQLAFNRNATDFRCCQFVELPIGEYDFSLIRHFLFSHAEMIRYVLLQNSSFQPLAELSVKIRGELKYHIMHADTWIQKLGHGNKESNGRMQTQLDTCFSTALGLFEPGPFETELASEKIFDGEQALQDKWLEVITPIIKNADLKMPADGDPNYGGRNGQHSEHLESLISEMGEVFNIDTKASW